MSELEISLIIIFMDTPTTNSINGDTIVANEKEILQIESDLTQTSISKLLAEDPTLLGGEDVAELLQRLSGADSMAQGMESRIDSVLQHLDEILALLGAEETPTTSENAGSTSGDPALNLTTNTSSDP